MAAGPQVRRGRPILFLGLLLAGWISLRVATWESPWPMLTRSAEILQFSVAGRDRSRNSGVLRAASATPAPGIGPSPFGPLPAVVLAPLPPTLTAAAGPAPPPLFATNRRAIGQNLLWMAGMADLPMPSAVGTWFDAASPAADPTRRDDPAAPATSLGRWRVDGWLVLRQQSGRLTAAGNRPASYGASQAGAVLAYRLAPNSSHDPAAYLRASKALVRDGEMEGAAGVAARPVAGLPVRFHAEVRVADRPGRRQVRPAVFASGGMPDTPLLLGFRAEGYAQAGYVGGDFATGFVDGRVTVNRTFAQFESALLDAGLGAWGGAQRGAARLEIGPRVQISLRMGDAPARLSADYRIRIAGDAAPGNGAAVTLSTGF